MLSDNKSIRLPWPAHYLFGLSVLPFKMGFLKERQCIFCLCYLWHHLTFHSFLNKDFLNEWMNDKVFYNVKMF